MPHTCELAAASFVPRQLGKAGQKSRQKASGCSVRAGQSCTGLGLAGGRIQRFAQPYREGELFVPAPSATFGFAALVIQLQNGAVFAQPVSLLVLRIKGVDIDDITVVSFKAHTAGNHIFPMNTFPGKAVSLGGRGRKHGLRVTQTWVYFQLCH